MDGVEEAELYLRWVQLGVFSPILRLHSTSNPYSDRRPWGYGLDTLEIVRQAMQLRRQLIPLLYSANHHNATTGEPLVLPLYYAWPESPEAYQCPHEYLFCQQLLAAPITHKTDPDTRLARQVVWLPDGDWYDFTTGEYFSGGGWYPLYCRKDQIPVFARAGAIIPLDAEKVANGAALPQNLILKIFAGADGSFTLYEDDGESQDYLQGEFATTQIEQTRHANNLSVRIHPSQGSFRSFPVSRSWSLEIFGISAPRTAIVSVDGKQTQQEAIFDPVRHVVRFDLPSIPTSADILIELKDVSFDRWSSTLRERIERVIAAAKMNTTLKVQVMNHLSEILAEPKWLRAMQHLFTQSQALALLESLFWKQDQPISTETNAAWLDAQLRLKERMDAGDKLV